MSDGYSFSLLSKVERVTQERDEAWRALRWIYRNGMQVSRPDWVSQVLSDAYGPVRAKEVKDGE